MSGYVYFIGSEESKIVKIGFTESDPKRRLRAIQTGCPVKVAIIAYIEGDRETERRLHETFAPVAMHGEWFRLEGKISDFLCYMGYYAEEHGLLVSAEGFEIAISDNVLSQCAPHPSVNEPEWNASAIDSFWEHLREP